MAKPTVDKGPGKLNGAKRGSSILGAQKLVAFVATRDAGRAKVFYRDILGLRLVSEDPFAVVFDANGTMVKTMANGLGERGEH